MTYLSRGIETRLRQRMKHERVVILEGARATGKTRLLLEAQRQGWVSEVRSFASPAERAAAEAAPSDYIAGLPNGTAIDEVQLFEEITLAIKERIDTRPEAGQFILTGSTRLRRNSLGGSDPFAGRVGSPLVLGPLTIGERSGTPLDVVSSLFEDSLFEGEQKRIELGPPMPQSEVLKSVVEPGLPEFVSLTTTEQIDRAENYLSSVTNLEAFESRNVRNIGALARYLAGRTSTLVNISAFAEGVEIARSTVDEYLAHLEEALLVHRLPAWRSAKDKSETAKPKIHFFDTGLAVALAQLDPTKVPDHRGRIVETMVVTELLRQAMWAEQKFRLYHWRRSNKDEVDLIIEDPTGRVICVEVKSSENVEQHDFRGIDAFESQHQDRFHRGIVFYSGEHILPFGEGKWAIPFAALRRAERADEASTVVEKIISRRTSIQAASAQMKRRETELISAITNQLEKLGEGIGLPYEITSTASGPNWTAKLVVTRDDKPSTVVEIGFFLNAHRLFANVPSASARNQRHQQSLDERPAELQVAAVLDSVAARVTALLVSWDNEDAG